MQVAKVSHDQVVKNSFWKFLESVGVQIVQLVVTVILARLLGPNDYGLMALVLVSVNFLGLFVNSSIASYLVYIRDIRKQDFLTALISNLFVSFLLFILLLLFADNIADYYKTPLLTPLLRAMAFVLPLNAISSIYTSYAQKVSLFRTLFIRNMISLPTSGVLALISAFSGLGVWSLVIQQLTYNILLCFIVVKTIKVDIEGVWRFERNQIAPMFRYGGMALLTTFVAFVSDNLSDLLIGKRISAKQLGYFNRGSYFPGALSSVVNNVVAGVLFPAFASYNTDMKDLKAKYSKSVRLLYLLFLPFLFGMIACAGPMVNAILSEKWVESIPIIQIFCLYYCALPLLQTSSQITLATGHLRIRTVAEMVKMMTTIVTLFFFIDYGIVAVAIARLLVNISLVIMTVYINKKIIGYGFCDYLKDLYKPLLLCVVMLIFIYPIVYVPTSAWIQLFAQVIIGAIVYLMSVRILKVDEVNEIVSLVVSKIKSNK